MKAVYLAQLKCENNHCILGAVDEFDSIEEAERALCPMLVEASVKMNQIECGLCQSRRLHVDVRATPYETVEEARLPIFHAQREQMRTAAIAHKLKQSRN